MCKSCRQLACDERCQIKALMSRGDSIREIARELGRSPATISREIARHRGEGGCRHHRQAQDRACARRSRASGVPRKMTLEKWQQAEAGLREGWSPEQVPGRFRLEGEEMASHEWICRHVLRDRKAGGELYRCLRRRGRKPNWRAGRHSGRGCIPGRALLSPVDRRSKYTILELLASRTAARSSPVTGRSPPCWRQGSALRLLAIPGSVA